MSKRRKKNHKNQSSLKKIKCKAHEGLQIEKENNLKVEEMQGTR